MTHDRNNPKRIEANIRQESSLSSQTVHTSFLKKINYSYLQYQQSMRIPFKNVFCFLALFNPLSLLINSLATRPHLQTKSKYIEAGSASLNKNLFQTPSRSETRHQIEFNATFINAYSSYRAINSLQSISLQQDFTDLKKPVLNSTALIQFSAVICGKLSRGIKFCLNASTHRLSTVSVRYLIVDQLYSSKIHQLDTYKYQAEHPLRKLSAATPIHFQLAAPSLFLPSFQQQLSINAFILGLALVPSTSLYLDIQVSGYYVNATALRITFHSQSITLLTLQSCVLSVIGFNNKYEMQQPLPILKIETIQFNSSSNFLSEDEQLQEFNTFWGITSLQTSGTSTLQWSSQLNHHSLSASSNSYSSISFIGVIFWTIQCESPTLYLMMENQNCYDFCPDYYYEDTTSQLCLRCHDIECLKCNQEQICALYSTKHQRQLFIPCSTDCLACNHSSLECTQCIQRMYLNKSTCISCDLVDPYCLTCTFDDISLSCLSCKEGYILETNICKKKCGNGVKSLEEECDDNNTIRGDGCSQFCKIEDQFTCGLQDSKSVCARCIGATYQSGDKSTCVPCANYDCATCKSNGDCLTCSNFSNRYFDYKTKRCLPLNGYYDDGSHQKCLLCHSQCLTCSGASSSSCLSCRGVSILKNGYCVGQNGQTMPLRVKIMIITTISFISVLCCILFCCFFRRTCDSTTAGRSQSIMPTQSHFDETISEQFISFYQVIETTPNDNVPNQCPIITIWDYERSEGEKRQGPQTQVFCNQEFQDISRLGNYDSKQQSNHLDAHQIGRVELMSLQSENALQHTSFQAGYSIRQLATWHTSSDNSKNTNFIPEFRKNRNNQGPFQSISVPFYEDLQ